MFYNNVLSATFVNQIPNRLRGLTFESDARSYSYTEKNAGKMNSLNAKFSLFFKVTYVLLAKKLFHFLGQKKELLFLAPANTNVQK